jgi:D-serine deaminase-like pyridoxal phosphate-dependent protein
MSTSPWYAVSNVAEVPSPALLVYPDRVERNIDRMIAQAGDVRRLRPHVKTHKTVEVTQMMVAKGITKVKAATLPEAEVCAIAGMPEVLLSFPQVGPNIARLLQLVERYPKTKFTTLADDPAHVRQLSAAFAAVGRKIEVWLDLDVGQHRSGIEPGDAALAVYRLIHESPGTTAGGLHVYDGQVRELALSARIEQGEGVFAPVTKFMERIQAAGLPMQPPACGGSPTFPVHARHVDRTYSPGTCVFWDHSYATKFQDLQFEFAALLLGRVVSKPGGNRLCLDLGYKSVSPDNPTVRVELLDLPEVKWLGQWEEHLAVETPAAASLKVGDPVYGVPYHVCPTVALHRQAYVVRNGCVDGTWKIASRDRFMTFES